MRAFIKSVPRQPLRLARAQPAARPFSYAPQLRLKEDKPQDPQEIEKAKQEQLKDGKKKEELESASEASVHAEKDSRGPEELQKATAQKHQEEHPEGRVHQPVQPPLGSSPTTVGIYLPRGPILADPAHDAYTISILRSVLPHPIVQINYRHGTEDRYPIQIHDVMAGYDWIRTHLLPKRAIFRPGRSALLGRTFVCGELLGGQLATMLALTECRVGETGVVAAAVNNPIVDWVSMDAEDVASDVVHGKPLTKQPTLTDLLRMRDKLFRKPEQFFDPFASPALFFRSAGADVPIQVPELDDYAILARLERDDFFREQLALSAISFPAARESVLEAEPAARKRKVSRRFPSKTLGLRLPSFHVAAGDDFVLRDQAQELADLLCQSYERERRKLGDDSGSGVSENKLRFEARDGLGLWDDSATGRSNAHAMAAWLAQVLDA